MRSYSNSRIRIAKSSDLEKNEIILSTNYALSNSFDLSIIGTHHNFMDIRDEFYKNYYDNVVSLYDNYKEGFIVKDIDESNSYDYLISEEVFDNLVYEYDYYQRPSYYHIEASEKIKNITDYKIKEENIESFYNTQQGLDSIRIYAIIILSIFMVIIILNNYLSLNQFINKNVKSIGIFKSFGYTNEDIRKTYNWYYFIHSLSIVCISIIGFSILYVIIEQKEKNDMLYNQIIPENYPFISLLVLALNLIIFSFFKYLIFRKINSKDPIILIR